MIDGRLHEISNVGRFDHAVGTVRVVEVVLYDPFHLLYLASHRLLLVLVLFGELPQFALDFVEFGVELSGQELLLAEFFLECLH